MKKRHSKTSFPRQTGTALATRPIAFRKPVSSTRRKKHPSVLRQVLSKMRKYFSSAIRFGKKMNAKQRSRNSLEVIERRAVGDKSFVALVRVGKQKFLIGGAPSSISLLAEIGQPQAARTVVPPALPMSQESA